MVLQDTTGTPVVLSGNNGGGDLFGGQGGFGGFLLGALLTQNGGLFGNRGAYGAGVGTGLAMDGYGAGYGRGYGYPAGGYYAGNVQGEQSSGIRSLEQQVQTLTNIVNQNQINNELEGIEGSLDSQNNNINSIARDLTAGQAGLAREVGAVGAGVHANLNAISRDFTSAQNNMQQEMAECCCDTREAINNAAQNLSNGQSYGFGRVNDNLSAIARDNANGVAQIGNAIQQGNFTTLSSINGLGRDVVTGLNAATIQSMNAANGITSNMNQGFNDINRDSIQNFNALNNTVGQGFVANNATVTNGFNGVQNSLNGLSMQNQNSFNNLNTNLLQGLNTLQASNLQGFNEVGRDTAIATNQIIAGQNAIAAQMASCCCDIKEKIGLDGGLTRQLVNDIRLADLNAQLTDAKADNSNLRQTSILLDRLSPVVDHRRPC